MALSVDPGSKGGAMILRGGIIWLAPGRESSAKFILRAGYLGCRIPLGPRTLFVVQRVWRGR